MAIVIHATFSLTFGLLFGVVSPTLPPIPGGPVIAGGVLMPLLWSGLCHGFMGIINPSLQRHVNWFWFVVSQVVYGVAMSIVVVRSQKVLVPPAGSGPARAVGFTGFQPGRRASRELAVADRSIAGCIPGFRSWPVLAGISALSAPADVICPAGPKPPIDGSHRRTSGRSTSCFVGTVPAVMEPTANSARRRRSTTSCSSPWFPMTSSSESWRRTARHADAGIRRRKGGQLTAEQVLVLAEGIK